MGDGLGQVSVLKLVCFSVGKKRFFIASGSPGDLVLCNFTEPLVKAAAVYLLSVVFQSSVLLFGLLY